MPTVLVSGANRGLGLEFARQYLADGWRVLGCCRAPEKADALHGTGAEVHRLDVTSAADVAALTDNLGHEAIDLLINNAGIMGPRPQDLDGLDLDAWDEVMRVNALAPIRVAHAIADQVAASDLKRMAFISSRLGSMAENTSGGLYYYRASKAALNAGVRSLAADLANRSITSIIIHPGWVQTDMGGAGAALTPTESVTAMRRTFAGIGMADNGKFFNYDGADMPW